MGMANYYMLADETLDFSDDEEQEPYKKHHKKTKGEEPSNKRPHYESPLPLKKCNKVLKVIPRPRRYTLLNSHRSEILSYIKEEGYAIQTLPPFGSAPTPKGIKIYIAGMETIRIFAIWKKKLRRSLLWDIWKGSLPLLLCQEKKKNGEEMEQPKWLKSQQLSLNPLQRSSMSLLEYPLRMELPNREETGMHDLRIWLLQTRLNLST